MTHHPFRVKFTYATKKPSPIINNPSQSIFRLMKCISCITLEPFKNPIAYNDLKTHDNYAINKWVLERDETSLITRVPIKINYKQYEKNTEL